MEKSIYDTLYFTVSRLHRNIDRIANNSFKSIGLAPTYSLLLLLLNHWKELSPSEISEYLDVKPSTTTRFLDKLETDNFIQRRYQGKYSYITLTDKGKQKIPEIQGIFETMEIELNHLITKQLTERQIRLANEIADKIKEKR